MIMVEMIIAENKKKTGVLVLGEAWGPMPKINKEATDGKVNIKSCKRVAPINPRNKALNTRCLLSFDP